ncbi:MAG: TerC family protein [Cyclobacteriaceae bacterium]|nr:TerC family protein [Cyclobacteriaceae bacterium]
MFLYSIFDNRNEAILFSVFCVVIILFLAIDLGIFNRKAHIISTKAALIQSIFWVMISLVFGWGIYVFDGGPQPSLEYFSAYLTEYALSVDNIFVILMILQFFEVKEKYYHKVLFWGIMGAVIFRAVFIFAGAILVSKFAWILYIFGAFLVYSGVKIYIEKAESEVDPGQNRLMLFFKKRLNFTEEERGGSFFFKENGKVYFTTLFLVVILVESTDIIFAVDSIPAAFAITQNEFLIYTSNVFAILGLRAKFFLLAGIIEQFYLLKKGLSIVLIFIGGKMLLLFIDIHIPIAVSFSVIIGTLSLSIFLSLIFPKDRKPKPTQLELFEVYEEPDSPQNKSETEKVS